MEHEQVSPYPSEPAGPADPRVADAVRRLDELPDLPPAQHVEVYESVHHSLQDALAEAAQPAASSDDETPGSAPS